MAGGVRFLVSGAVCWELQAACAHAGVPTRTRFPTFGYYSCAAFDAGQNDVALQLQTQANRMIATLILHTRPQQLLTNLTNSTMCDVYSERRHLEQDCLLALLKMRKEMPRHHEILEANAEHRPAIGRGGRVCVLVCIVLSARSSELRDSND